MRDRAFAGRAAHDEGRIDFASECHDRVCGMAAHGVASDREVVGLDGPNRSHLEKLPQILDLLAGSGYIGFARVEHGHDVNFSLELPAHEHGQLESASRRIGKIIGHNQTWNQ
ncbi:MAG: hypothetical protein JRJ64_09400 [Deltaproteobacteria bacterium]|nr:hypothetical protein [Deltaproteobacteria bacterium]